MSSLTSTSTVDEIIASYTDNASYQEDASPAKARAFVTACRILLIKLPSKTVHGRGGSIEIDLSVVQDQLAAAQRWLATNLTSGPDVLHPSLGNFRDFPSGGCYPPGNC